MCYEHKIMPQNFFSLTDKGLLKYKDKCVKINSPQPSLTLTECPAVEDIETFGIWEVVAKGHTWGKLHPRRKKADGTWGVLLYYAGDQRIWKSQTGTNAGISKVQ